MATKTTQKSTRTKKATGKRPIRSKAAPADADQIRRTYRGKELIIDVVDGQFVFEGQTFTSLSALAKSIVGYGISGPHFFRMTMPAPGKLTGGK